MAFKMLDRLSAKIGAILKKENDSPKVELEARMRNTGLRPFDVGQSVAASEVEVARDHLRMMEVEREILSHAIRRLYEAEADGKITKGELKSLVHSYKKRIIQVKNTIQKDQTVVALYKLEIIQDDLMVLFDKHFEDLNNKIVELRTLLGVEPSSVPLPKKKKKEKEKRRKRKKRSSATKKSKKGERIEEIRAEVDKTLERLERLEINA